MKTMSERIRRNMAAERKMQPISIRVPEHVIEDLKEVAPTLGFSGYQALIRAYISQGLRHDLARLESERQHGEIAAKLEQHGVAREIIEAVLDTPSPG